MRNWKPYIADVVKQMRADGITSRSRHLPCPAELAHQRRPLPPRCLRRGWRRHATRISSKAGPTIPCSPRPLRTSLPLRKKLEAEPARKSRCSSPPTACPAGRSKLQPAGCGRNSCRTREDFLAGCRSGDSRPLPGRRQKHRRLVAERVGLERLAMVLRLPEPGPIRWPLDRPHRRRYPRQR